MAQDFKIHLLMTEERGVVLSVCLSHSKQFVDAASFLREKKKKRVIYSLEKAVQFLENSVSSLHNKKYVSQYSFTHVSYVDRRCEKVI
jgi:hypothetical protein